MNVGVQPYTLTALEASLPEKLDRIGHAGFEGVELAAEANTDRVHEKLVQHGLSVSSIGTELDELDERLDAHVAAAEDFGVDNVVLYWIDPEEFESRETVEATADRLDAWAERLATHNLQLHYHNHGHEFTDLGEMTAMDLLIEETETVQFEIDLGWAGTCGGDPAELLSDIGDRVTLVHVKDMDFRTGEFVRFGDGDLDLESVISAAKSVGVEWALFENDDPVDPVAELAHASVTLDKYTDHYC